MDRCAADRDPDIWGRAPDANWPSGRVFQSGAYRASSGGATCLACSSAGSGLAYGITGKSAEASEGYGDVQGAACIGAEVCGRAPGLCDGYRISSETALYGKDCGVVEAAFSECAVCLAHGCGWAGPVFPVEKLACSGADDSDRDSASARECDASFAWSSSLGFASKSAAIERGSSPGA